MRVAFTFVNMVAAVLLFALGGTNEAWSSSCPPGTVRVGERLEQTPTATIKRPICRTSPCVKAANAALEKANLPEQTEEEEKEDDKYRKDGELPVERFILSVEKRPVAKSIVARHGLSPKEFGLASYALIDASLYLTHEAMAGKAEAARMQAKLTREQQANIALVRKLGPVVAFK